MEKRSVKRKRMWKVLLAVMIFCAGINVPKTALAGGFLEYIDHYDDCCKGITTRDQFLPGSEHDMRVYLLNSEDYEQLEEISKIKWSVQAEESAIRDYIEIEGSGLDCKITISSDFPQEYYAKKITLKAVRGDSARFEFYVVDSLAWMYRNWYDVDVDSTITLDNRFYRKTVSQPEKTLISYNEDDVQWYVSVPGSEEYVKLEGNTYQFTQVGYYEFYSEYTSDKQLAGSGYGNCRLGYTSRVAHKWDTTTYTWNEDYTKCTAKRVCTSEEDHVETEEAYSIESKVTKEADCENAGVKTYCALFEDWAEEQTVTVEIPALGHKEETIAGVAATCTAAGKSDWKKCTVCGKVTVEQVAVPALGHKEETIAGVAATCTAAGKSDGKKCTVCGTVTVEQVAIPALGHKEETVAGVAATCTAEGKTDGKKCAVCNEILQAQTVIPALGHTEVEVSCVPATTEADGTASGKKCSVCGERLSGCETIYKASVIKLDQTSFIYDGKAKTPKLIVKDAKDQTIASDYYTVKQSAGRKNVGTYQVTVTLQGNYTGEKTLEFIINPKGTGVSKVAADKKSLKITLKKQTKQTSGYEVQVSTDKNFKKNVKKATVKDSKKTTVTVKNLKSKTKYYIRVRTYKTVKNQKYYSDWKKYNKVVTTKK